MIGNFPPHLSLELTQKCYNEYEHFFFFKTCHLIINKMNSMELQKPKFVNSLVSLEIFGSEA